MKAVQYFTPEYLASCRQMTPEQILQFLEDFRLLFAAAEAPAATHLPGKPAGCDGISLTGTRLSGRANLLD